MISLDLRRIAGVLSQFWAGGAGPTANQIRSAIMIAGSMEPQGALNKQDVVQLAITQAADDETARILIEELVGLLRESGTLDADESNGLRLSRVFKETGHLLDPLGFIEWDVEQTGLPARGVPEGVIGESQTGPPFEIAQDVPSARAREVSEPDLGLLMSILRRIGGGAVRPLIERRRDGRPSLTINDEYDMQDVVGVILRCLYNDVRDEERTPSSAGSSSQIDTYLRERSVAIEIKVTRSGRGEREIKKELLVDVNDYQRHPGVRTLIAVVFDLASTFDNPGGFEHDLTRKFDSLDVHVIVVPWTAPPRV